MPRVPVWWEVATACLRCGIVVCPATTRLVDKDIEYRANRSGATVFVGDEANVQKLMRVKKNCSSLKHIVQIGKYSVPEGATSLSEVLQAIPENAKYTTLIPGVKDPAMIYL